MKKLLAAILLVVMVFCFASCGGVTKSEAPTLDYLYNTNEGHKAIGEYIQSALAAADLNVTLTNQEWNTFLNTRKDGDYTVARNGWLADYSDPISFLDMWTSNSGNNDAQFGKGAHKDLKMYNLDLTDLGYDVNVKNGTWAETYDVLIAKIKACTDTNVRYKLMHKAEDMIMDTGCLIPLYYYTDIFMIDDAVNGFFANPLGYKYFMYTTIEGKNSINVCLSSEPDTIDPALNSAVDGATMLAHLFQGLAKWSQKADGTLEIVADAATALPEGVVNADGTVTYTYTLRDGLKWSNGDDVKASDFEYSWKRAASNALAADYGYMFEVVKGYGEDDENGLSKISVVADDAAKTLTVTLANAVSYWNELLAFPTYYPVHKATVASESWATEAATYVCNGPYTISAWDHNSCITLTKNANFVDAAKITMPEIKCFLSDDANNMLTNFKNGTWQLIDDVPTNEIKNLEAQYPTEYKVTGQIGTYYVNFNINADLLPNNTELTGVEKEKAQQEIRKAIGLLLDRNYICEEIGQAGQVPAPAFVPMGMTDPETGDEFYKNTGFSDKFDGYYDVSEDAYEANVDAAIKTLQKYYTIEIAE
ncbi:MAG: peptide ABC transporter substrate-binding protein [Clostridia bacterium]|nr:peptide ABC transporter substrate-binding protein [Clostridia bacterium]MBQ8289886.1 peptide ABC transporter substrate-binding protein [Clostridia bacterium]